METIPTFWIGAGLLALVGAVLIWRLGARAERSVRSGLEQMTAREIAAWLETRVRRPRHEILSLLNAREAPPEFAAAYDRHIDFVFLEFERQGPAYFLEIRVEKGGEPMLSVRRRLALDDLPSTVQGAFLRGETRVHVPWYPEFQDHGAVAA